jgi:YesN/AraC family two-component response regulator
MEHTKQSQAAKNKTLPHILLMEDEPNVAKGLKMVMDEQGYQVDWAATGEAALEAFWSGRFDLLVADIRLPDIDGMEVIERVKDKEPDTPVVIITGYPSMSSAIKAVKIGVTDYLRKPFTEEEFMTAVDGALKKETQKITREEVLVSAEKERLIQKREVIRVLNRTTDDALFWQDLMNMGSEALEEYNLSPAAKAAIASGDLKWINDHVGELTQKQLMFIYKRLEREAW